MYIFPEIQLSLISSRKLISPQTLEQFRNATISFVRSFFCIMSWRSFFKKRVYFKAEEELYTARREMYVLFLQVLACVESWKKINKPSPILLTHLLYYRFKTLINLSCSLLTIELAYTAMAL